ncbi:MAG: Maf family protein, partial [Spirochaetales bacterium]|nr:Maf family protein [Candidatus Physcosoma equi]
MNRIEEPSSLQIAFSKAYPDLVLASSSPNRRGLLEKGGSTVTVFVPDVDEDTTGYSIEEAMKKNARIKLEAYLASPSFHREKPAISADTLVHIDG